MTRTTIKEDPGTSVVRVHFEPGAQEPPHTHPYDVALVFVANANVALEVSGVKTTAVKSGEVFIVPRGATHSLGNPGSAPFELITVAFKTGS